MAICGVINDIVVGLAFADVLHENLVLLLVAQATFAFPDFLAVHLDEGIASLGNRTSFGSEDGVSGVSIGSFDLTTEETCSATV